MYTPSDYLEPVSHLSQLNPLSARHTEEVKLEIFNEQNEYEQDMEINRFCEPNESEQDVEMKRLCGANED